jgi:glycosyltransferase involved in cell wall biosynthesis
MARKRLGLTMYRPAFGGRVSGLARFQERLRTLLEARGGEVVPIRFSEREDSDEIVIASKRSERRFFMPAEARAAGIVYPESNSRLAEECLALFRRERLDALHLVEWMPSGMALWDAALRWGGPTAITPTEYGAICQYGFLLCNCGTACIGPEGGAKCGRCTHSLEPFPARRGLFQPWYSRRHRLFHRITWPLPDGLRCQALWALSEQLQPGRVAISEAEGRARLASARRFLTTVGTVAYQSPHQYDVFQRAVGAQLPAPLPMVMPIFLEMNFEGKDATARSRPVTFLFAARPNFDRGLWLLLDAWERWSPAGKDARLLLHTHDDGSGLARRCSSLRQLGCDVQLAFGVLGPERLREIHRSVHFVVNPAVWEEPGSSTVIEGLFLGTPAIVPTETGSADFIEPRRNGYRYRFRDVVDLVTTLQTALDEMDGWQQLHAGALESAREYHRLSEAHVDLLHERLLEPN